MRYIAYALAIFAAVFVLAFTTGFLPRDATASQQAEMDLLRCCHLGSSAVWHQPRHRRYDQDQHQQHQLRHLGLPSLRL